MESLYLSSIHMYFFSKELIHLIFQSGIFLLLQTRIFTKNNLWSNIYIHWCLLIYTMIYEYICKIACRMVKEQSWKTDQVLHLGKHPIHIFIERFSVSYNTASFAISLLNVYFLPFHPLFFCPLLLILFVLLHPN